MKSAGVVFLQETHTDVNNQIQWLSEWKGQAILSHGSSVSAGVAICWHLITKSNLLVYLN